jgi:hypothetical protein
MNRLGVTLVAGATVAAFTGVLMAANGQSKLRSSATAVAPIAAIPGDLPELPKGAMTISKPVPGTETLSVLQFDDNSCEAGLGVNGAQMSALVEFDPTPPCTAPGPLQVVNVTARVNTGTSSLFVLHNPGATPGMALAPSVSRPITTITASGPCPANPANLVQRAVTPVATFTPGNATNFYAGLQGTVGGGTFVARDTTTNANRMWLLCSGCGMTQYTPAQLAALGFPGNWHIRVTVEDAQCVPVELQNFEVSD